jgi:DNA-binding transcriptional LysR family regulator
MESAAAGRLSWDDLRVYLAVREGGTLAAAARSLKLDPTTVGRRLDRLEEAAGARLFARTTSGFMPTEVGDAIAEHVDRMARGAALVDRVIGGGDKELAGRVRISTTDVFAMAFLLDHLSAFRAQYPKINLELVVQDRLVDLSRGDADIAVRFGRVDDGVPVSDAAASDVVATLLGRTDISLFGAKSYLDRVGRPADPYDMRAHSVVCPTPLHPAFPGAHWFERVMGIAEVSLGTDSPASLGAAIASGMGIAAIAHYQAAAHPELEQVCPPVVIDTRNIWLLVPVELRRIARVRAAADFIADTITSWSRLFYRS